MIEVEAVQGSRAWFELRFGVATASQFSRIVTRTGRLSAARETYIGECLAEYFLGEPWNFDEDYESMIRGRQLEPEARSFLELSSGQTIRQTGFCYMDEARNVGFSPDGIYVGDEGIVEIKCSKAPKHLCWLSASVLPAEHFAQVQGTLWISKAPYVDFLAYHPQLPELLVRVEPDEKYHAALEQHMPGFLAELAERREALKAMGMYGWNDEKPDPTDVWETCEPAKKASA